MLRLLEYLIFGHIHEWELIRRVRLGDADLDMRGTRNTLQCKKCGNIKKKDLI